MRVICLLFIILSSLVSILSCSPIPDYSPVPTIVYRDISYSSNSSGNERLTFTIDYQDGDGNLGLNRTGADTLPPFQALNTNRTKNPLNDNFHTFLLLKQPDGSYDTTYNAGGIEYTVPFALHDYFRGRFSRLKDNEEPAPLEGTMQYTITDAQIASALYRQLYINIPLSIPDSINFKFRIYIYDRSLNKSNEVETDAITITL